MLSKNEIIIPTNPPRLIIIAGPCRVGTTALSNIFAKSGITAYMQPIKSARRATEEREKAVPWIIKSEELAVVKETIGPATDAEFFDPVKILLELGYQKDRLALIPIVRDFRKVLPSWRQMWETVDVQKFVRSYELTLEIANNAKADGVKVIPFVHESIRDQNSGVVMQNLFNKLNFKGGIQKEVINWNNGPKFGEEDPNNSKINFYDVPPERFVKEVKEWGSYQFREEPELRLPAKERTFLENNTQLIDIYEQFRKGCQDSLELKIQPYRKVNY